MWQWTYTRYSGVADEDQKKKVLGIYISNFEIDNRYFCRWEAKHKKKLEGNCLFKLSEGGDLKKRV